MRLTDVAIRKAKPRERPDELADGRGLTLLVQPSGAKWWRFRYRVNGAEKMLSLGIYPDVSLSDARERMAGARCQSWLRFFGHEVKGIPDRAQT